MTLKMFRARAVRLFLKANPTAAVGEWTEAPRRVTYPTGLTGIRGRFVATAAGYKTTIVSAEWDARSGLSV